MTDNFLPVLRGCNVGCNDRVPGARQTSPDGLGISQSPFAHVLLLEAVSYARIFIHDERECVCVECVRVRARPGGYNKIRHAEFE